jgi:hypothetical protein
MSKSNVVDLSSRRPAKQQSVCILIGEDDRGLFADVDGAEIRSSKVNVLMQLVASYVVRRWRK